MALEAEGGSVVYEAPGEERLGFVAYLLAASSPLGSRGRLEALDAVAEVVDEAVAKYMSPSYVEALQALGYPLVDVYELVEAMGAEGLEAVLSYAEKTLRGERADAPAEVRVYADLLGWTREPEELSPRVLASAILISFVASLNRTVNETIEAQDD